jgi:hypothetical protein
VVLADDLDIVKLVCLEVHVVLTDRGLLLCTVLWPPLDVFNAFLTVRPYMCLDLLAELVFLLPQLLLLLLSEELLIDVR